MDNYSIENKFISRNGSLKNIRNIQFQNKRDLLNGVLELIIDSNVGNDACVGKTGIYLYKSLHDKEKALRIYKDYGDYPYSYHYDDLLITKLQAKQKSVKLTKFPTGIVTLKNSVIGQEVPFYENYQTIREVFLNKDYSLVPTYYCLQIYKIIKELYDNGIIYIDVYWGNFLIKGEDVKLIDFEDCYISFNLDNEEMYYYMIKNFKIMLIQLSRLCGIELESSFNSISKLEGIGDSLQETNYTLIKKR